MDLNKVSYRGASVEFVLELGMLTIAAAGLEDAVYVLGGELALDPEELRRLPASSAADRVLARLSNGDPLPPWTGAEITVEVLSGWLREAKGALGERNLIIHSNTLMKRGSDGEMQMVRTELRPRGRETHATAPRVRSLRERVDRLISRSKELLVGVMPQVAHGIYLSFCGGRGFITVGDENGYPDTRTRPVLVARGDRIKQFWVQFMADGGGSVTLTTSPAGTRAVPPWFGEAW